MKDIETSLKACAKDPKSALAKYDELWHSLIGVCEEDASKMTPKLKSIAQEIAKIPLKQKMLDTPKVLIVGEIYVRRDDFAVDELITLMSKKGIIAKVAGIAEWIYYCDYVRKYELDKKYSLLPFHKKFLSKTHREIIMWHIEMMWKHHVDHKVLKALKKTNLIPKTPHNMNKIMDNANSLFVTSELESEISVSSGVAATSLRDDYSGVVNISPFACLIGRVIEGLLAPWARENRLPVMSVEIAGDILPPNIINKLEIFILNVLRFRAGDKPINVIEKGDI
jgi:predicted nucleotide-binding protein (sugar kinase/HSP70/actin superfamily)